MCGIAGMIAPEGKTITDEQIRRMTNTIVHRGPDDEGIFAQGNVGLGMRRLSIIDLSGGSQPIYNEDRSIAVVFNGEIYNFRELRKDLEGRGHRFYTHTDTEVIVHLYEEMGADCVKKLRGMFAIALYDARQHSLLLARDRLGKKPLHYAWYGGELLFGSEIKTILALRPEWAVVDREGLLQYFYFGYIPDPHTVFGRIRKLPAGHLIEYRNGDLKIRQYWDLPEYSTHSPMSEDECLGEMERRLAEAVRLRMISDVPLGALLSGGVDSSIIVALMARASARPVKTFSIGFRAEKFNESEYARMVAERFGTDHHELVLEPDIEETLNYLSTMMEEPFGDSSMLPTYYVCRMARRQVTVALSGDGGDELFAGYDRYPAPVERSKLDALQRFWGPIYRRWIHGLIPAAMYGKNMAWNASLNDRDRYLDGLSFFPVLHRERELFTREFVKSVEKLSDPLLEYRRLYDDAPARDRLSRLLYLDTKTYLNADILAKVDRMSMAASLEVRVPMLDHEFVEWVTALPVELKFREGTRKRILKKLAERLGIPAALLHRKKQGFQMPLVDWMRNQVKTQIWGVLLEPRTLQRGYFNPAAIRSLVDEHMRGRRNRSGLLWRLLVLELWHRNFMESRSNRTAERRPPDVFASEFSPLPRPAEVASAQPGISLN